MIKSRLSNGQKANWTCPHCRAEESMALTRLASRTTDLFRLMVLTISKIDMALA